MSTHDSIDSLVGDVPNTPVPACPQDTARNNIIRELVETERKYVQDLEVMQVRALYLHSVILVQLENRDMLRRCPKAILSTRTPSTTFSQG
jgi:cell division control protein 24